MAQPSSRANAPPHRGLRIGIFLDFQAETAWEKLSAGLRLNVRLEHPQYLRLPYRAHALLDNLAALKQQ